MKRRKLLIGASGVTASALAIGTGAFSAARVERNASITVTTDADGLVGLVPNPDVAGVKMNSSQLAIDLEDPGVNVNSVYQFGLFEGDLDNDYPENFPFKAECTTFQLRNRDRVVVVARLIAGAYFGCSREYHTGSCRLQTLPGPAP